MSDKENNTLSINTPKADHIGYYGFRAVHVISKDKHVTIALCVCLKTEQYRVLKIIHFQKTDDRQFALRAMFEREKASLNKLRGVDGIVQLYGHFQFTNTDETHLVLVLEYVSFNNRATDMMHFFERYQQQDPHFVFSEENTNIIMKSLINNLVECKRRGIMHRDLKLENIMVRDVGKSSMEIVLIDFGLSDSDFTRHKRSRDVYGTPGYISPLQLTQQEHDIEKSDVFSLGVICFCLLFARFPTFRFIKAQQWYEFWVFEEELYLRSKPDRPLPSDLCKDFMECMMQWKEMDRDSLEELAAHNFLRL